MFNESIDVLTTGLKDRDHALTVREMRLTILLLKIEFEKLFIVMESYYHLWC